MILRRASSHGGSVRLEKYETEEAAGNQASVHCAVYDLGHARAINRMNSNSKPVINIILDDYSNVNFSADSSKSIDSTLILYIISLVVPCV